MPKIRKNEEQERQRHLRQQLEYEIYWRNRIFLALRRQKRPFMQVARKQGLLVAYAMVNRLITGDELDKVFRRMYEAIGPVEAERFYRLNSGQKQAFSFDWMGAVREWLNAFLYNMITRMTEVTRKQVIDIIANGLEQGLSYEEIIKQLGEVGLDRVRAATIARTESNRAMAWAKWDSISRLPYPADIVWIAAGDKRTRGADSKDKADHFHLNGTVVPYMQPFTDPRSGAKLLFPGDISMGAGAADTVNCRCTIAARRRRQ